MNFDKAERIIKLISLIASSLSLIIIAIALVNVNSKLTEVIEFLGAILTAL